MRISTSTMNSLATSATSNAYDTYYNVLKKITDNKNFTKVSEDIVGASNLIKVDDNIAKLDEYQSNIQTAISEMSTAYDTLNGISDELGSISSLIIEASNATTTPDSAKAISAEIEQRVNSVRNFMNTKYMDNYIFSGNNTQTATYKLDDDGNTIYQGSDKETGDRKVTIAEGKTISYNVTGDELFKTTQTTDDDGNVTESNFFSKMKDLCALLVPDDGNLDYDAIRKNIDVLSETQTSITNATAKLSAKVSKLDTTQSLNESTLTSLKEKESDIIDVDITKAATDLASAQTSLEASYKVSQVVLSGMSLLDYI